MWCINGTEKRDDKKATAVNSLEQYVTLSWCYKCLMQLNIPGRMVVRDVFLHSCTTNPRESFEIPRLGLTHDECDPILCLWSTCEWPIGLWIMDESRSAIIIVFVRPALWTTIPFALKNSWYCSFFFVSLLRLHGNVSIEYNKCISCNMQLNSKKQNKLRGYCLKVKCRNKFCRSCDEISFFSF